MATIFNADTTAKLAIANGTSNWNIDGIASSGQYSNVFLRSFSFEDVESTEIKRCFNDVTHIFAYGRDLGSSELSVILLVGIGIKCPSGAQATIDDLRSSYNNLRIYNNLSSVNVSIDGFTASGYLVGFEVSDVDPSTKFCTVKLTLIPDMEV